MSPNFGMTDHLLAAHVREIDAERSRQVLLKHLVGPAQIARVDIARVKGADIEPAVELRRMRAQVDRVEPRRQRFAATVNLHLTLFRRGSRRERHFAAPENHDSSHAGVCFRDKRRAGRHSQLEILQHS